MENEATASTTATDQPTHDCRCHEEGDKCPCQRKKRLIVRGLLLVVAVAVLIYIFKRKKNGN